MAKPTTKPGWNPADPLDIVVPSGSKKNTGFSPNEKPPSQYFNWFWKLVSDWIDYLDTWLGGYTTIGPSGDYATINLAIAAGAKKLKLIENLAVTAEQDISLANAVLKFNGYYIGAAVAIAGAILKVSGNYCRLKDVYILSTNTSGTTQKGLYITGNFCNCGEDIIEQNGSGGTLTDALNISGNDNIFTLKTNVVAGTITNRLTNTGLRNIDIAYKKDFSILSNENNYILPAKTNNSFSSTASNNPYTFYFDDGKPRYGCERLHFMGLEEISEGDNMPCIDSNGLKGYHPIDARTNKPIKEIGFYGSWWVFPIQDSYGFGIQSISTNDYIVFTGIFNKANLLTSQYQTTALDIYVNGVDTTNDISITATAGLGDQQYSPNQIVNIPLVTGGVSGIAQGINTVKLIKKDTAYFFAYGIEMVNEAHSAGHEICVPSCIYNIQGKEVSFAAYVGANALPLKGSSSNGGQVIADTKGGFCGYYADITGVYISKKQEPTKEEQAGTINDNGGSSDSITVVDSTKFYANSQGNLIRVKDATNQDRLMLVPTAAPSGTEITCANDYDGVADATLFAGNKQFRDDGVTGSTFANSEAVTVELYAKLLANADHSNEELFQVKKWDHTKNKIVDKNRTLHFVDMGNQRTDDFTSASYSIQDLSFTAPDGSTCLVAEDVNTGSDSVLQMANDDDFYVLTFFGTGLDIQGYIDVTRNCNVYLDGVLISTTFTRTGITKICSDLPLGFHVFKIVSKNGAVGTVDNFLIYRPKKSALAENYEYSFINYILADYVRTNVPTLAISTNMGAIDQGVVRKQITREGIFSGTWTYGNVDTLLCGGRDMSTVTNADYVAIQAFMSGYFRTWLYFGNAGDDEYVNVDGANQQTNNPGATALHGYVYNTSNPAEGLHTLKRIAHRTAGTLYFDSIDYHAPVFNQYANIVNPFPDYIFGQVGTLDNRKFTAFDIKPDPRVIQVVSKFADLADVHLLACSVAIDFREANVIAQGVARCSGGTNSARLEIQIGTKVYQYAMSTLDSTYHAYEFMHGKNGAKFSKREKIILKITGTNITMGAKADGPPCIIVEE